MQYLHLRCCESQPCKRVTQCKTLLQNIVIAPNRNNNQEHTMSKHTLANHWQALRAKITQRMMTAAGVLNKSQIDRWEISLGSAFGLYTYKCSTTRQSNKALTTSTRNRTGMNRISHIFSCIILHIRDSTRFGLVDLSPSPNLPGLSDLHKVLRSSSESGQQ